MHLSAPVWHWLESLPGFIGLEAQTLTKSPLGKSKTSPLLLRHSPLLKASLGVPGSVQSREYLAVLHLILEWILRSNQIPILTLDIWQS